MTSEEFQKAVLDKLTSLENKIDDMEVKNANRHLEMDSKIDKVLDEVKGIRKDLSTVEIVTANNYADIARLKSIK